MLIISSIALIVIAWLCGTRRFIEAVILTRSFCDPLFTLSKLDDGGGMGLGASVNLAVIAVAVWCVLSRPQVRIAPVARMWGPFLLVCLVAVPFSPDPPTAFRMVLVLVSHAVFCLLPFYVVQNLEDLRRFLLIIVASSLVPTLTAFTQLALGLAQTEDGTRVQATFSHPNIYAFYLMVVLAVMFVLLAEQRFALSSRMRCALTLYIPVVLGLILLTKTRSVLAGTALIFLTYALLFDRRSLLYLLGLPVMIIAMPELVERFTDLQQGNYRDSYESLNSYAWRVLLWQSSLDWIAERPWFGWGLVGFPHYVAQFFPLPLANDTIDAHSVLIQLLFDLGAIGLVTFLWIYLSIFNVLKQLLRFDMRWSYLVISLMIGYLFMAYSDNMLAYLVPTWYMWFLFGGCWVALNGCRASRQEAKRLSRQREWNSSAVMTAPATASDVVQGAN
ncbi:hypothetical protein VQ02_06915 [Methylobacterium variabile]|jgi:O-antigen ligase|uniref:O-antigen ligase-related domain-containing protein n=1 Tax=Methylobacterium variabile TaxID=298794 RepID=A0A0J6T501_9HYPH|nr:O-antigen ligase family protein [Methylobacterium variabile]KMO40897.1 hypothetical protein VQ02_06915 [Methylobacterium variabile]